MWELAAVVCSLCITWWSRQSLVVPFAADVTLIVAQGCPLVPRVPVGEAQSIRSTDKIQPEPRQAESAAFTKPSHNMSRHGSAMQKTYDDCYLICSMAVQFENQVKPSDDVNIGF